MDAMVDIVKVYAYNSFMANGAQKSGSAQQHELDAIAAYIATGVDNFFVQTFAPKSFVQPIENNSSQARYQSFCEQLQASLDTIKRHAGSADLPRFYNMMKLLERMKDPAAHLLLLISSKARGGDGLNMLRTVIGCYQDEEELLALLTLYLKYLKPTISARMVHLHGNNLEALYLHSPAILEQLLRHNPHSYLLRFYMLHRNYDRYCAIEPALIADIKQSMNNLIRDGHKPKELISSFIAWAKGRFDIAAVIKDAYMQTPAAAAVIWQCCSSEFYLLERLSSFDMPLAPIIAAAANDDKGWPRLENLAVYEYIQDHSTRYDTMRAALAYATHHGKCVIYFYLNQCGQAVDIADWERALLDEMCDSACNRCEDKGKCSARTMYNEKTEKLRQYLSAEADSVDDNPSWLGTFSSCVINVTHNVPSFIASLLGKSALALRTVKMLLFWDYEISGNDGLLTCLQKIFTVFTDKQYAVLNELDNKKILSIIAKQNYWADIDNAALGHIATAIARQAPEQYKTIFANADNALCLYMAKYLPADFDTDFIITLLSRSKKLADMAINLLKDRRELRDEIHSLTESKKKSTRENAERLLAYYDGKLTIDIATYYKKYAKTIEKTLEWTNPANWPKVH
ncbi:MAG: hypothetical protein LBV04_05305, partial [Deferribacteraceae bacterium]|nr:hypothetical protein [Deferribacteraceae bacterium]